ncbi:hypothetical protein ScPMuIL_004285 [Solemya velum]
MASSPKKRANKGHMEMSVIYDYLKDGKYPRNFNSADKRTVRKRAKDFSLKDNEMYHITIETDENGEDPRVIERLVLKTSNARWQSIVEAHVDSQGNHRGMEKTSNQLSEKYYWVGISIMVRDYIRKCVHCQSARGNLMSAPDSSSLSTPAATPCESPTPASTPVTPLVKEPEMSPDMDMESDQDQMDCSEVPEIQDMMEDAMPVGNTVTYFWEKVEVQVLGPFYVMPKKELYVIMFVDVFSLWPEAMVTDYVSASVVTQYLLTLIARYGLMQTLICRKTEAVRPEDSTPMTELLRCHDLPFSVESGRYSELDETWSTLSKTVLKFVEEKPSDWFRCLDFCLLPHRISRSQRAEYTPSFLAHGREPVLPPSLSYRQEDSTVDPHLTEEQMNTIIAQLFFIYTIFQDDLPPSHLSHGSNALNTWKKTRQSKLQDSSTCEDETNNGELFSSPTSSNKYMQTRSRSVKKDGDISDRGYSFRYKRRYPEADVKETARSHTRENDVKLNKQHSLESLAGDGDVSPSKNSESDEKVELDFYYQAIYQYVKQGSYPPGSTDYFKRLIRKTTSRHKIKNDVLYYVGEKQERVVVMTRKERFDRLRQAHVAKDGSHIAKNKMIDRLSTCFWKGLTLDAEAFVQACPFCNFGSQRSHIYADQTGEKVTIVKEENDPEKDEAIRIAEENYNTLFNFLKTGKISDDEEGDLDSVKRIHSKFRLLRRCLYYKDSDLGSSRLVPKTRKEKETYLKATHMESVGRHYSLPTTLNHLRSKYIWTDMDRETEEFVGKCVVCNSVNKSQVRQKVMKTRRSVYQKFFDTEDINDKYLGLSESQIEDMVSDGGGGVGVKSETETGKEKEQAVTSIPVEVVESSDLPQNAMSILNLVGLESRTVSNTENEPDSVELHIEMEAENSSSIDPVTGEICETDSQSPSKVENPMAPMKTELCDESSPNPNVDISQENVELNKESVVSGEAVDVPTISTDTVVMPTVFTDQTVVVSSLAVGDSTLVPITTLKKDISTSKPLIVQQDPIVEAAVQTIMPDDEESVMSVGNSVDNGAEGDNMDDDQSVAGTEEDVDEEAESPKVEQSVQTRITVKTEKEEKIERILKMSGKKKKRKNSFKCEYCDAYISGKIKYTAHLYRHTGKKAFQCEECGKKFTCAKTKRIHMRKHTGNLPFLCSLCGKGFPRSGGLRSHLRTHERGGGIAVRCDICDRVFASENRLQRHRQFKHPDTPVVFKCDDCQKVFSAQRSLKRHRESHHLNVKNHICPYCGKTFFRKEYLNSHLSQHTGESKHKRQYPPKLKIIPQLKEEVVMEEEEPVLNEVSVHNVAPFTVVAGPPVPEVEPPAEVIVTTEESAQQILASADGEQVQMYQYYTAEDGVKDEDVIHVLSGGGTLLFSTPGVQYEVECESSSDQIDAALSAINLLAQASATHTM